METSSASSEYDLKRRLVIGLCAGALLLFLLSVVYWVQQVGPRMASEQAQLARTMVELKVNYLRDDFGDESGPFVNYRLDLELKSLQGIGMLVPFCASLHDIHDRVVDDACYGDTAWSPQWVSKAVGHLVAPGTSHQIPALRYPGVRVGWIRLRPNEAAEASRLWGQLEWSLLMVLGIMLMSAGVYAVVRRALQPTQAMMTAIDQLEQGDLAARMPPSRMRELHRIGEQFNHMAARLQKTIGAQRVLADRLLKVREEERRRLARELHDELGQRLTSINAEATYAGNVSQTKLPELMPSLEAIERVSGETMASVQRILQGLRPPGLDTFGLDRCLEQLGKTWEGQRNGAQGVKVDMRVDVQAQDWNDTLTVSAYRLVQEALTNAFRHGQATHVAVDLSESDTHIRLTIVDNGQASSLPPTDSEGHGILGMRERVDALGGRFDMAVVEPHGLKVDIHLPNAVARALPNNGEDNT
ncbi:histidine kinase [Hydrogenophaga sp. 5NK40-0174]|uniref:histidine kinase n=1 Tax=Hydrogenophaga sp. 5NK40-0174 TaxID=3127649 RepID=UPI003101E8A0